MSALCTRGARLVSALSRLALAAMLPLASLTAATPPAHAQASVRFSLSWKGAWSSTTRYMKDDLVRYSGSTYKALIANVGQPPAEGTYWTMFAERGSSASGDLAVHNAIADLTAITGMESNDIRGVKGYGFYYYDPASTATANGTHILAPDVGSGRWLSVASGKGLLPYFLAKDYGVVGGGVVDDTVALQAAATAAGAAGGGIVVMPDTDIKITAAVLFDSYVTFQGAGPGTSTRIVNTGTDYAFKPRTPASVTNNAGFKGFRISGDGSGAAINDGGIMLENCLMSVLEDIELGQVPGIGVYFYGSATACYFNTLSRVRFTGSAGTTASVKFDSDTAGNRPNANRVDGCVISGGVIGIDIVTGDSAAITNTAISDTTGRWIRCAYSDNRISTCRFENGGATGGGVEFTAAANRCITALNTYAGGVTPKYINAGSANQRLGDNDGGAIVTTNTVDLLTAQAIGGAKTFSSAAAFSNTVTIGGSYLNFGNIITAYNNLTSPTVYSTGGGGVWPFTEAGHIMLNPRTSGFTRGVGIVGVGGATAIVLVGTGDPNGVHIGSPGSLFLRTDGGAGTSMYIKESGSATNTGWVAK